MFLDVFWVFFLFGGFLVFFKYIFLFGFFFGCFSGFANFW